MIEIQRGDVIQIAPGSTAKPVFGGKLAFVEEVKSWGVVAFVDTFTGRAYVRLPWNTFERIGEAVFLPSDFMAEEQTE